MSLSRESISPLDLFDHCQDWLDKLEQLAIQCLMPNFKKENLRSVFHEELQNLANEWPSHIASSSSFSCAAQMTSNSQQAVFGYHTDKLKAEDKIIEIKHISNHLLDKVLSEFCHGYSLWWTQNKDDFMLCQGLPTKEMSTAFIDKDWQRWGWHVQSPLNKLPISDNDNVIQPAGLVSDD